MRRRIGELNDRRIVMVVGRDGTDQFNLQAHSITGLTNALPVNRLECPERRDFQEHPPSVTPAQFDAKLKQLEEEQDRIIRSAHIPSRPIRSSTTAPSWQQYPQRQQEKPVLGETLVSSVHLQSFRSTIADLPPLDLSRVDRDFPLLFLANVCESVRAYH